MSVADAKALAEVADLESEQLLAAFELRRRAANERSVGFTRRAAQFFRLPQSVFAALFPAFLGWVGRHPDRMAGFLRGASTAFQEQSVS
jgi:2-polyprenyl-6-methoxyphenol hydroxylase-like FAD-dependent oxidoreductase